MGFSSLTMKEDVSALRRIFAIISTINLSVIILTFMNYKQKKNIYMRAVVGMKERGPLFKRKSYQWYFLSKAVETQVVKMWVNCSSQGSEKWVMKVKPAETRCSNMIGSPL